MRYLNLRLKHYGLKSRAGKKTIINKITEILKGLILRNKKQSPSKQIAFDSMDDAFLHIYYSRNSYDWYRGFDDKKKRAYTDTAYQIKQSDIGVSRERLINMLSDYFDIEERFYLEEKENS